MSQWTVTKQQIGRASRRACAAVAAAGLGLGVWQAAHAQASAAPGVGHMALIIGNADYDGDGNPTTATDSTPAGMLRDLKNACNDAQLVKRRLLDMGWREEEITFPKCNLTAPEMRALITTFRGKVALAHNTLAIFYFSGHGAEIASGDVAHTYLFGVGAKIDTAKWAESLNTSQDNTSFAADEAVDLHEFTSTLGVQTKNGVLVILDACRDSPVYNQLTEQPNGPAVLAVSANPDKYTGILVAYATSRGAFAKDGFGSNSIYTKALTDLFKPTRFINSALDNVRDPVVVAYKKWYPNQKSIQEPDREGQFSGDWCIYACPAEDAPLPLMADAGGGPQLASASLGRGVRLLADPTDAPALKKGLTPRVAAPVIPLEKPVQRQDAPKVVFDRAPLFQDRSKALPEPGMRFDVFWCDGGDGAADRERRANVIAAALGQEAGRRQANVVSQVVGKSNQNQTIGSVRVRVLPQDANASFGYRYTGDVVIYDAGDDTEVQWSKFAAQIGRYAITPQAETARTPGYMSIFVCREAQLSPSTAIFFQAPPKVSQRTASAMVDQLTSSNPGLLVTRPPELRSDGPNDTEIRFYHQEDRDNVFKAAGGMEQMLGHPVRVKFLDQYASLAPAGRMEIWLGSTEPPVTVGRVIQRSEALQKAK